MKEILITGASGFLGFNLTQSLLKKKDCKITCVYNKNKGLLETLQVRIIQCDLSQNIDCLDGNYDVIIHLAGEVKHTEINSSQQIYNNYTSSINIFNLAKKISKRKKIKFIFTSTIGVVGCFDNNSKTSNENSDYSKISEQFPYYKSKMMIENFLKNNKSDNILITILRPPVMFGEGDFGGRATKRIRSFLKSKIIFYTCGNIPICDVKDVIEITENVIYNNENKFNIYNVNGHTLSVYDFYNEMEKITGDSKIKIYIPYYIGLVGLSFINMFYNFRDVVELKMGCCYWNSSSLYLTKYPTISYNETLLNSIKYIKQ